MSAQHAEAIRLFPWETSGRVPQGASWFLLQEPSDEAKRVSSTPQDKSAAMREDLVRQNALAVIRQRGGIPQIRWRCWETMSSCWAGRGDGVTASSEDDQLVGFGARAKSRWKEIWDSRGDGYADFVIGRRCVPGTRMSRLQQNLLKRQQPTTSSTPAEHPMKAPAEPLAMEEDVEMEREMLSIHNSDLQVQSYAMLVAAAALPRVPPGAKTDFCFSSHQLRAQPSPLEKVRGPPWSQPGTRECSYCHKRGHVIADCLSLKRRQQAPAAAQQRNVCLVNKPELLDMVAELPSPNFFQLHPFFIWKPESHIMVRLRNNDILPCLHSCPRPQVVSAGVGRPRVIVSVRGQYLIFSSRLCCKACRRNWSADNPPWVEKLPVRFTNLLPAFLTYKKAACKSVMDELRRSGKSPTDMANQVNELMHLKYERAHLAYLHAVQNVREAEAGAYGQRTIGQYVRMEDRPRAFGPYVDQEGWGGVSVSGFYLTDCLLDEFKRQQPSLTKLLQGTLGQVFRSDHTRKMARKVTLASGAMSSFAVMNENWLIVSWVMVQAETERSLHPM
ncbi:hypothetical protein D4764_0229420 [Takifugu flavidus]|uniref:DUF6729 domain-containing protein n=1 Tax=Takifugu flavidus TaxID=433684 RepID=A0A5C6MK37_9TELE|nr:hypothetical protein D4764_0229420 [Takifugu flavidus]